MFMTGRTGQACMLWAEQGLIVAASHACQDQRGGVERESAQSKGKGRGNGKDMADAGRGEVTGKVCASWRVSTYPLFAAGNT